MGSIGELSWLSATIVIAILTFTNIMKGTIILI